MNTDPQDGTLNLRDLLAFLARGALLAFAFAGLAAAGAYLLIQRQPAVYEAEATLLLASASSSVAQVGVTAVTAPPIDLPAYGVAATSDAVLRGAHALMGTQSPSHAEVRQLRRSIAASAESTGRDSSLLLLEARGPTDQLAVRRANAVASALVAWDRGRATETIERVISTLVGQIEALSGQIRSLQAIGVGADQTQIDGLIRLRAEQQQQLAYARALVASPEALLSLLQEADSTVRQIAPRPVAAAVIAAVVAALLTYGLLLARVALNTRLVNADDIAVVTGLPVLAHFPSSGRGQHGVLREPSSYLRTNLLFATVDAHPKVFMVTSSVEGEGKTTVARQLAESFVRYGYRTLLADCDLRAPSVANHYAVNRGSPSPTTTEDWLKDPSESHRVVRIDLEREGQLDLIPQFEPVPNASEALGRGFRAALQQWTKYDVVIIDTPPVLAVADPLTVAPHCTGTIVVVDRNRSDRRTLTATVSTLERVGVRVLGVVSNNDGAVGSGNVYGAPYGSVYAQPAGATRE